LHAGATRPGRIGRAAILLPAALAVAVAVAVTVAVLVLVLLTHLLGSNALALSLHRSFFAKRFGRTEHRRADYRRGRHEEENSPEYTHTGLP
jgi:hypothetical protein